MASDQSRTLLAGLNAQQLLWLHWLRSLERLKALGSVSKNHPPLNQDTPYSPERHRQADAAVLGYHLLNARMLRIEGYLGHKRPETSAPPALEAMKTIRANIERGYSDEAIALFLEEWREPERKRGRPQGSNDSESVAVLALQLHDSNPKLWTWPKVADQLLRCEAHKPHDSESSCAVTLKKAASRLRSFLRELERD